MKIKSVPLLVFFSFSFGNSRGFVQSTADQDEATSPFRRNLRPSPVHVEAANALFPLDVSGGCTSSLVIEVVAEACDCLAEPFLAALLDIEEKQDETNDFDALHAALGQLCATAWEAVDTSFWQDVDQAFSDTFMERFVHGETYLNRT